MKSAEELASDARWRRRHSIYLIWALPVLAFVGLLYTGIRARRWSWVAWGVFYAGLVIVATAVSPEDEDSLEYAMLGLVLLAAWIASAAHLFAYRRDWLRWKAIQQAGTAPVAPVNPPRPGPLSPVNWADPAPTSAAVGPANWAQGPPPPPAGDLLYPPPPPLPGARPNRESRRWWIVVGVSAAVVLAIGLFVVLTDVVFTDDLMEADFAKGSKPFVTGESPDYVLDLSERTYRIRSRTGAQSPAPELRPVRSPRLCRGHVGGCGVGVG